MPAKKPPAGDKPSGPKCESSRPVPEKAGGGEVRLYNAHKQGLPELVTTPPEALLADHEWFLVHFPSRRWGVVMGDRQEGMRLLAAYGRGENLHDLLPPPVVKKVKGGPRASAGASAKDELDEKAKKAPVRQVTKVPEGADFDQAMQHVFPIQRITEHFERLLTAEEDVYDKDGHYVGSKPSFPTQMQALRALVEWHQGKPGEKPKKKDNRPVVSLSELRGKLLISPEYRAAMRGMIDEAEKEVQKHAANKAEGAAS